MESVGKLILLLFPCALTINSLQHLPFSILCTHGLQLLGSPRLPQSSVSHYSICLATTRSYKFRGFPKRAVLKEISCLSYPSPLEILWATYRNMECLLWYGHGCQTQHLIRHGYKALCSWIFVESSIVYVINQSCKNYMGARLYHVDIKWRVILCLIQVNSKKN